MHKPALGHPSSTRAIQSPGSQHIALKSILILSSHPRLGLQVFPLKLCMHFWIAPYVLHVLPISVVSIWFLIMLDEEYNACSSSLCNFLHSLVISSLFAPNVFLSTLSSNTLNLCFSLNVRDQVSQPYYTTGNIIVSYVLTFSFLKSRRDDKIFSSE